MTCWYYESSDVPVDIANQFIGKSKLETVCLILLRRFINVVNSGVVSSTQLAALALDQLLTKRLPMLPGLLIAILCGEVRCRVRDV